MKESITGAVRVDTSKEQDQEWEVWMLLLECMVLGKYPPPSGSYMSKEKAGLEYLFHKLWSYMYTFFKALTFTYHSPLLYLPNLIISANL